MKILTLTLALLMSLTATAFAAGQKDPCFRFLTNTDRATILMQKKCSVILKDSSNLPVKSAKACLSKLKNQFKNKISYALLIDMVHDDARSSDGLILINTVNAKENNEAINIDLVTASPELMTSYKTKMSYDKGSKTLSVERKEKFLFGRWKEKYDLEISCN